MQALHIPREPPRACMLSTFGTKENTRLDGVHLSARCMWVLYRISYVPVGRSHAASLKLDTHTHTPHRLTLVTALPHLEGDDFTRHVEEGKARSHG